MCSKRLTTTTSITKKLISNPKQHLCFFTNGGQLKFVSIPKSSNVLLLGSWQGDVVYGVIDGRAFSIHSEKKQWIDARQVCLSEGGDLATVDQLAINDWISKENRGWGSLWIGATVSPN